MTTPHCDHPNPDHPWNKAVDVRFSELTPGMKLIADEGFTCLEENAIVEVKLDAGPRGGWYVPCEDGYHFLDGQKDHHCGTDIIVGLRRVVE